MGETPTRNRSLLREKSDRTHRPKTGRERLMQKKERVVYGDVWLFSLKNRRARGAEGNGRAGAGGET